MFDNLQPFYDELEKISAQKCRAGSMPIRAQTLADKETYDGREKTRTKLSFIQLAKDLLGMSKATSGASKLNPQTLKALGLVGVGGVGALTADQAAKDWSLGRQIRKQQQG